MRKKVFKYGIINLLLILLVYCVSFFAFYGAKRGGICIQALFQPYAYTTVSMMRAVKGTIVLAELVFLFVIWLIKAAKNKSFDPVLGILSFIFPLVGFVLGIIYRVRQQKDVLASNAYLLFAIASVLIGITLGFCVLALVSFFQI